MSIANKHIPNQIVAIRPNDVPWYNSRLRKLKRIRDRSYSYAKRHSNSRTWETYRANRNTYNCELRAAEDEYYNIWAHKLLPDNKMAPEKWWQTVKSFLGKNSDNDIPLIDDGEKVSYSNNDKAEAFNKFFLKYATLETSERWSNGCSSLTQHLGLISSGHAAFCPSKTESVLVSSRNGRVQPTPL